MGDRSKTFSQGDDGSCRLYSTYWPHALGDDIISMYSRDTHASPAACMHCWLYRHLCATSPASFSRIHGSSVVVIHRILLWMTLQTLTIAQTIPTLKGHRYDNQPSDRPILHCYEPPYFRIMEGTISVPPRVMQRYLRLSPEGAFGCDLFLRTSLFPQEISLD